MNDKGRMETTWAMANISANDIRCTRVRIELFRGSFGRWNR